MHILTVCNPGHFHAALTLRQSHPSLNDEVHIYSEPGPDLDRFLAIVKSFNERKENPTRWNLHVVTAADYLDRLIIERPGGLVVIAGRTDAKIGQIHRLHGAGFALMADKPWLLDESGLPRVREVTSAAPPAIDIMTNRHEALFRLMRALVAEPEVFGGFAPGDPASPALEIESTHHLYKIVNNRPLQRPAWFFDTAVQGRGIVDISTHLVDLCMFFVEAATAPGRPFVYGQDATLVAGRRWPTEVRRNLFARITGLEDFPQAIRAAVQGDRLAYDCNGQIDFRLRGVACRTRNLWEVQDPPGSDHHSATARGRLCTLAIVQGPGTNFRDEFEVRPNGSAEALWRPLEDALRRLQPAFPGIAAMPHGPGWRVAVPDALRIPHEAQFALVRDGFIDALDGKGFPNTESPNLLAKYSIIAHAAAASAQA